MRGNQIACFKRNLKRIRKCVFHVETGYRDLSWLSRHFNFHWRLILFLATLQAKSAFRRASHFVGERDAVFRQGRPTREVKFNHARETFYG